ncbi:MAG: hypothetical protein AAF629_25805, partial [Chloroflexota bacterium]
MINAIIKAIFWPFFLFWSSSRWLWAFFQVIFAAALLETGTTIKNKTANTERTIRLCQKAKKQFP